MVGRVIILLVVLTLAPAWALRPTFDITVSGANREDVQAVKDWLDSALASHPNRIVLASTGEVKAGSETPGEEAWSFTVFLQLESFTKVRNLRNTFTKARGSLPDVSVRITLHFCPEEGEVDDWRGCDIDERAQYETFAY